MTAFDPVKPETWPLLLTPEQTGAIYGRTPGALKKHVTRQRTRPVPANKFIPMPAMTHPYRWRKVDILRHVEGARGSGFQKASGF